MVRASGWRGKLTYVVRFRRNGIRRFLDLENIGASLLHTGGQAITYDSLAFANSSARSWVRTLPRGQLSSKTILSASDRDASFLLPAVVNAEGLLQTSFGMGIPQATFVRCARRAESSPFV
ncbi:hypothetical protein AGR4A_pAt30030 [Agrobacterium tumefaciens str. B6]|uniref:Uncharacterized protein n=1 Tax=Agrobacterium tumefaciens str. B6 TaxID=1183423 RepID=A0A822VBB7_AGRTU|nr:hypothetical protein AGR4A_pAt30030 [Agrobacterium tumefaciens str. B6]